MLAMSERQIDNLLMGTNADVANIIRRPVPERLKAIEEIWDSIALEPEAVEIPEWHRKELRHRLEAYQSKPKDGSSWADVRRRIEEEHRSKS